MSIKISVECADVVDFPCDILVLKFAQGFYGADQLVASRVSANPADDIQPVPGDYVLLPSNGNVKAKRVLFVGVPSLYQFDYPQIRDFASQSLDILRDEAQDAVHIAMTVHGVGYGLDERESFLAQIAGVLDAFRANGVPPALKMLSIVERNRSRASRLKVILEANLPESLGDARVLSDQIPQVSRIAAGRRAKEKSHVFVAMPFNDAMEDVYIFGIQGPANAAGFLCERVDMTVFTGDILARIKSRIETAALVIADLTGANPNVYLEVGYAWGRDRTTLLLLRQTDELKFDVSGQRTIVYKSIADLAKKLKRDLALLE